MPQQRRPGTKYRKGGRSSETGQFVSETVVSEHAATTQRVPLRQARKSDPLPKHLRLTPERRQRIQEQQQRLKEAAIARGRLSPDARQMQLGMAHEMSARSDVEMLESEVRKAKGEEKEAKRARLEHARSRLAEALSQQGRFEEAGKVEPNQEQAQLYRALWRAVWRDDEETCRCKPFVDGDLSLTHDHVMLEVISQKHDSKLMPAIKCNECGCLNVRPLTRELKQIQRARDEAAEFVRGKGGKELKTSAHEDLAHLADKKVLKA